MQSDEATRQAVLQAEAAWTIAHLTLDLPALDHLMADEYTIIQPGGVVLDKATTLASLQGEQRHWDAARSDEHQVRVYGGTAVVIGRWTAKGVNQGEVFDYAARYTAIWVKRDGRWQMVGDQSTEIR
ncbi:MAG: nuclear transport factor 2 family protein [Chloroflexota bacterium]|nr:nuclear transport factor 2 family protein [Chloroflexota bacterium]